MGIHKERAAAPQMQANPNLFRRLIAVFSRKKALPDAVAEKPDSKQAEPVKEELLPKQAKPVQKTAESVQTREERLKAAFKVLHNGDLMVRDFEGTRKVTLDRKTLDRNQNKLSDALFRRYREIYYDRSIQQLDAELSGITVIMVGSEKELSSIKSVEYDTNYDSRREFYYKYLMVQDRETGAGYVAIVNRYSGGEKHRDILLKLEKALNRVDQLCPLGGGEITLSSETGAMQIYGFSASFETGNHEAVRDLVRESLPFAQP